MLRVVFGLSTCPLAPCWKLKTSGLKVYKKTLGLVWFTVVTLLTS